MSSNNVLLSAFVAPGNRVLLSNGAIAINANVYVYAAGTTTPTNTYSDVAGTVLNPNPIPTNSVGYPTNGSGNIVEIRQVANQNIKCVITDSTNTTLSTWDNVPGVMDYNSALAAIANNVPNINAGSYIAVSEVANNYTVSFSIPQTEAEANVGITPTNSYYPELYVERYGADPTGSNDSGVAFRAACSVAGNKGGGVIYALGEIYLFNTWDTTSFYTAEGNLALFLLPANTALAGGGQFFTKLRISQTARTGMYDGGANRTHIIGMPLDQGGQYVHDLQFDYDGIVQAAANDYCYFIRTMAGNCLLERLYGIQAPITNAIVDSSVEPGSTCLGPVIVRECWFQDCGPNMTGNEVNSDCSYLYLMAPGSYVEKTRTFNSNTVVHNCGGMEFHCAQYYATQNYIKNCFPGMYLGVGDGVTISIGSVVTRNYIGYCNTGINIIDQHVGLQIRANHLEACTPNGGGSYGYDFTDIFTPLNTDTGVNSAGTQTALAIEDNTIDCTLYSDGTSRASNGTASAVVISINMGTLDGASISRNQFVNAAPYSIYFSGSTTGPTQYVMVEDNLLLNCTDLSSTAAYFGVYGASASGWANAAIMQNIYFRNNHAWRANNLAQSAAYSLIVVGGGSGPVANLANIRFESNDLVNINPATDLLTTGTAVTINGQASEAQSLTANGQTINTAGFGSVIVTSGAAYAGLILQAGTYAGQTCRVINQNANEQTMAASGTSNVADGTSCVIAASRSMLFTWDIQVSLWYHD